jgi:hypothetical protein
MQNGLCSPCGYLTAADTGVAIYDSVDGAEAYLEGQDVPIGGDFKISSFQGGYSAGSRDGSSTPKSRPSAARSISKGAGTITGTLDAEPAGRHGNEPGHRRQRDGDYRAPESMAASCSMTPTRPPVRRFISSRPTRRYSMPISGGDGKTQPIARYLHQ